MKRFQQADPIKLYVSANNWKTGIKSKSRGIIGDLAYDSDSLEGTLKEENTTHGAIEKQHRRSESFLMTGSFADLC